ncbi:hypothetical protein AB0N29_07175 [Nocardioides sp. NPDC092400]|uniref:hypothetical protein n=1 Tax=Nocardioides sp. NPDC092400 TaxID=3155196 RepID=UPI00341FD954
MRIPALLAATATAATAITGLTTTTAVSATSSPSTDGTTTHERGNVVECGAAYAGQDTFVSVYENNLHPDVFQVVVGEDGLGRGKESTTGFIDAGTVRATMRLDGRKVVVSGTAKRVGKRIAVHEEVDDAGEHVVVDGFHRRLRTDLTLRWKGRTVALDCDEAFFYDLDVTRYDTTGD